MTTIVWRDKTLHADRKFEIKPFGFESSYVDRLKLFTHSSRKIAFSITGSLYSIKSSLYDTVGDVLLTFATDVLSGKEPSFDALQELLSTNGNFDIILMSREDCWYLRIVEDKKDCKWRSIQDDDYVTTGSGMYPALSCLIEEVSIEKLYQITSLIDYCTSSNYDSVKQTKLLKIKVGK